MQRYFLIQNSGCAALRDFFTKSVIRNVFCKVSIFSLLTKVGQIVKNGNGCSKIKITSCVCLHLLWLHLSWYTSSRCICELRLSFFRGRYIVTSFRRALGSMKRMQLKANLMSSHSPEVAACVFAKRHTCCLSFNVQTPLYQVRTAL